MSNSVWLIMEEGHADEPVGWRQSYEDAFARCCELNTGTARRGYRYYVRETDFDEIDPTRRAEKGKP
jgi:hypothetical protein